MKLLTVNKGGRSFRRSW